MNTRDVHKLSSAELDVLVVGGGVHGATVFYHLAKAGYRVAVVEKNDFCGATSANSLKILHGGLRYLQHGNLKRMRHSITARREMMQLAPYLVRPLPCIMPLYGRGLRSTGVMRTALFLNDCISWDRNQGLPEKLHLPAGYIVPKKKCLEVIPEIATEDLNGGAVWYDVLALNTERLVLEYILEGVDHGAEALNYAQVTSVEKGVDDLYEVTIVDSLSEQVHKVHSKYIVNASGPWFQELLRPAEGGSGKKQKWALALNIVSRKKIFHNYAVALEGKGIFDDKDALIKRGKRLYFFVPWNGYTMIGTEYQGSSADPDSLRVSREIVQNMVDEVNAIYPPAKLQYEDISFFHAGLLPMQSESEPSVVQLEKNSTFFEHTENNFPRVLSVKGVKYTTASWIAREITAYLYKQYQPEHNRDDAESSTLKPEQQGSGDSVLYEALKNKYGKRAEKIIPYIGKQGDIWLDEASQLLKAEVKYLVEEEMACKLADVVFRRTELGSAECPGQHVLVKTSAFMGDILGWDRETQEKEVEEVLRCYFPLVIQKS